MADEHDELEHNAGEDRPHGDTTKSRRARSLEASLESQRRTEKLLNPPGLRRVAEEQARLDFLSRTAIPPRGIAKLLETSKFVVPPPALSHPKALSGVPALPRGVGKLLASHDFGLFREALAGLERFSRFPGFDPSSDAMKKLSAFAAVGSSPAFAEMLLANQRLGHLLDPLAVTALGRDLAGVSGALSSVAALMRPPARDVSRHFSAIASSAFASWHAYVGALPPPLDDVDLVHVGACGRGILGVTASSAIALGEYEVVEVAEPCELAPTASRERMRVALAQLGPRLLNHLDGAWNAVAHGGPDAVSQAANSAVELIDWTLRLLCDADALEAWVEAQAKPSQHRDPRGSPTRRAKILYLLRGRSFEAALVAATAENLLALQQELQKLKHGGGDENVEAVARLLPAVEAILLLLVE